MTTPSQLSKPKATLFLLAFAQLIIALDYNIVFVALPQIAEALPFTPSGLQWVISAYAVVFGGFLMLGGRLSDLFGRRRLFIAGMVLYAVASLLGGLAEAPTVLVLARGLQGLGGALLAPATLSLVTTLFAEGKERNAALGAWAAAGSTGMVLGSLLGGILAGSLGWESTFFVNVPLALIGAAVALTLIPRDTEGTSTGGLDVPGAFLSTAGILTIVYGLVQAPEVGWTDIATIAPVALGVLLLLVFFTIERRSVSPLVPLSLFKNPGLVAGTATTFLFMGSFGAIPYFLTIYLQRVEGISAFVTGLIFMLPSACVLAGTVIGGKLSNSYTSRQILTGAWLIGGVGTAVLAILMGIQGNLAAGAIALAVLSLAQGVVFTVMFGVATATVPGADQGVASGIATSGQQVGGAVGLAVLVVVATALGGSTGTSSDPQFTSVGMWAIAALIVLGVALSRIVPRPVAEPAVSDDSTTLPAADAVDAGLTDANAVRTG